MCPPSHWLAIDHEIKLLGWLLVFLVATCAGCIVVQCGCGEKSDHQARASLTPDGPDAEYGSTSMRRVLSLPSTLKFGAWTKGKEMHKPWCYPTN